MRRMINLLCAFHPYDHLIYPNQEFFHDLARKHEVFQSFLLQLPSVPPVDSTGRLQGFFRYLWGSWFRSSFPGSQVFRSMARKTGLSVHRVQGPLPCCSGSLPMGSPYGPSSGSTSYHITAQWWKFCGLTLQESPAVMSLVRYLSLLTGRHSSFSLRPQLGGSLA